MITDIPSDEEIAAGFQLELARTSAMRGLLSLDQDQIAITVPEQLELVEAMAQAQAQANVDAWLDHSFS